MIVKTYGLLFISDLRTALVQLLKAVFLEKNLPTLRWGDSFILTIWIEL